DQQGDRVPTTWYGSLWYLQYTRLYLPMVLIGYLVGVRQQSQPCYQGRGVIPVHALAHAGIFELAIHGWDIRSALEPSVPLAPDVLAALLDFFAACPHWFFLPAARLSTPIRYRFACTGVLSGQWDVVVEGDQAHIGPAAAATPANVTFSCEVE